jgi:hypothetical protein
MLDLELIVAILLVVALAYVIYKAIPLLMVKEPFDVYKRVGDPEHRLILPPNAGLGSLAPDLLPLDKQNADMRGPYAYTVCGQTGKTKGKYRNSPVVEAEEDCLGAYGVY